VPRRIDRRERKAQLAEAVWRIAQERGIGAVSVRSVAEQAGVVVGSLRHVFPTRAELLAFSAELMVRRATERIQALPRSSNPQRYALQVLEQLLPLAADSRTELEVNIALIAEAPAQPELRTIRDDAQRQLEELCVQLVELLTEQPRSSHVVQQGRRLHALLDGLAIHLLSEPHADIVHEAAGDHTADGEWAVDILRAEISEIAERATAGRSPSSPGKAPTRPPAPSRAASR